MSEAITNSLESILTGATLVGNELWRILALFAAILASLLLGKIGQLITQNAAQRLAGRNALLATTFRSLSRSIVFVVFAVGLDLGMRVLVLGPKLTEIVDSATSVLLVLAIGWLLFCGAELVDTWIARITAPRRSRMDEMLAPILRKSLRVTLVILVLVQIAQILSDKPITSIIAGLGVGGLAVALAAQETIKNFFGSLVILADKPFELGDRIVVDGHDGPVEAVGFRSTKLRTLEGHLVTIPNGELANRTIQNIGKRPSIRRLVDIAITYDTPPEKVEQGISILRDLLRDHEGSHPDFPPRVYFSDFGSASLNLRVIYWYHPPDYWKYMEFSERFNLQVLRQFNAAGIDFAFPTQTLYLAGDPKRPLPST